MNDKNNIINDKKLNKVLNSKPSLKRLYYQEKLILSVTELISKRMNHLGINNKQLAEKVGVTELYIETVLDGTQNINLRSLSDIFVALGVSLIVQIDNYMEL